MQKRIKILIKPVLLFVFYLFSIFIFGQDTINSLQTDTLKIKAGSFVIINDSVLKVKADTLLIKNDTTMVFTSKDSRFYSKLQQFAYKNKITKKLYNAAFVSYDNTVIKEKQEFKSTDKYLASSGKIIRKIEIKNLRIFGPPLIESVNYDSCLTKDEKKFHINTSDKVIYKNLLFSEGDTVNPSILAENGKLLRDLPYIQNATIQVYDASKDSVDILIVVKDVFEWAVYPIIISAKKWRLRVKNVNVLGLGHEFDNAFSFDANESPVFKWTYSSYIIKNIGRSFIDCKLSYEKLDEGIDYKAGISRSFIPYKVNWGGGISFLKRERDITYSVNDSTSAPWNLKFNQNDIWIGKQFPLNWLKTKDSYPVWFVPAIRLINTHYTDRPEIPDSSFSMKNTTDILGSISFSKQEYYRVNYINEFGKTEDFPYGFLLKLTGGYSIGELSDRTYAGIEIAYGGKLNKIGLYYLLAEFGTYLLNDEIQQEIFHSKLTYTPPLIYLKNYFIRNMLTIDYIIGRDMQPGQEIYLNNEHGIKGLKTDELTGQQRFYLNLESNLFSPINLLGFRMSFFTAANIGFIGGYKGIFSYPMYGGYGIGIRVKNEFLVFGSFQLSFTYFPNAPGDAKNFILDFFEMPDHKFDNFDISAPSYIGYE